MAIFHFVRQERKDRRLPLLANMFGTKKNYATHIGFDVLQSQLLAGKMLFCFVLFCFVICSSLCFTAFEPISGLASLIAEEKRRVQ